MNAKEVKDLMIGRLDFFAGYMGAVHEATNCHSADIVAVRFYRRTVVEFEIKVSSSDLLGEIKAIRAAWGLDDYNAVSYTKFSKHRHYREQNIYRTAPPHLFYFCLPTKLTALAIEKLAGTPYGVYDFEADTYLKKARRLHTGEISPEYALSLFSRATTLWAETRKPTI